MCCALLYATFPGRKDVAFIKAKHGKGAAQNSRHTHSGGAQRATPLWKQVLLTLLVLVALLALLGGALWQNICYNRTHYTAEFYQIHSRKLTQSCRVVFLTDLHLREYGADNCELEQAVRAQAQELGITDHILFAGLQSNVADWYQMMDLFVMPSRFEGLPVVGIEAQAAGLGCVFSDAVPAEVLLSSHAIQIPLSASNADWAAGLQRMLHQPCDRSAGAELIRQAGYDINIAAARLQQQYLQLGGQA